MTNIIILDADKSLGSIFAKNDNDYFDNNEAVESSA